MKFTAASLVVFKVSAGATLYQLGDLEFCTNLLRMIDINTETQCDFIRNIFSVILESEES